MLSVFINVVGLVTVLGQATDPTTVCLPDVFQSNIFSLDTQSAGVIAFDFPNDVLAIRSSNGLRNVYNLSDYSAVAVNETDGSCEVLAANDRFQTIGHQCLPETAVLISAGVRHIGLVDSDNQFLGWKVEYPGLGTVIVALTTTSPAIPIIREFRVSPDTEGQIVFFFNPKLGVDDKNIFSVPDDCSPRTIVG